MAGSSLLTLIDDIASALDDVAAMTKVATKKTAGVLGDDLALNAEQVIGIHAHRELPVVWAVAKGSAVNKLILIPLALLINFFVPPLVTVLLMIGGLYLCFEGFEKIIAKIAHKKNDPPINTLDETNADLVVFEQQKIKGAVRTDFVLSAEIIVITLGIVAATSLTNQIMVLVFISLIMTVGVYGLVACIVKLDDLGFLLREKKRPFKQLGMLLIGTAPVLMRVLGVVGTIAMFLVGGGIIAHGVPAIHHYAQNLPSLVSLAIDFVTGIIAGGVTVIVYLVFQKVWRTLKKGKMD